MNRETLLIDCVIIAVAPFVLSCIKGDPFIGIVAGVVSFLCMGFVIIHGASMLEAFLTGILISGIGTAWALRGD